MFITLKVTGACRTMNAPDFISLARHLSSLCDTRLDIHFGNDFFDDFKEKACVYHCKYVALDFENAWTQEPKTSVGSYEPCVDVHEL